MSPRRGSPQRGPPTSGLDNGGNNGTERDGLRALTLHQPAENQYFDQGSLNWLDALPKTPHVDLFRQADFAGSSLGPLAFWGPSLRLHASMLFLDSRGAIIFWGPDHIVFYNSAYVAHCGQVHPFLMAKPFRAGFEEVADQVYGILDQVKTNETTVDLHNVCFYLERNGFVEESYFIGQFVPLRGDSGKIEGVYNAVIETTADVIHKRHQELLQGIAAIQPLSPEETLSAVMECLKSKPYDVPLAMIVSSQDGSSGLNNLQCHVSTDDLHVKAWAQKAFAPENAETGIVPFLHLAQTKGVPAVITSNDANISALFEGMTWLGHGEVSHDVVVVPLLDQSTLLGFYIQGTNPRRGCDTVSRNNATEVARHIQAKLSAATLAETSKGQVTKLTRRAQESEKTLREMAQHAPMGMCNITRDCRIAFANDQFWKIAGHEWPGQKMHDFVEIFAAEDRAAVLADCKELFGGLPYLVRERRLNRAWNESEGNSHKTETMPLWVVMSAFSVRTNDGVSHITGYLTDISHQKWAEITQARNAAAATDAKRQQEAFIDTTSHEMRNPLNAITQLADGIERSLDSSPKSLEDHQRLIYEHIEAARTISICASHQKRVIDDILTLSRLESKLLTVTPVPAAPRDVLRHAVTMVDAELVAKNIKVVIADDAAHAADWVEFDTSRVVQILLNFLTNAIKFTASSHTRVITLSYGIQVEKPPLVNTSVGSIQWNNSLVQQGPNTARLQNTICLYFCVQDTGTGMSSEETRKLFKRFSQTSARTHIDYGGSGLGLYICRQLAEAQGGGVGAVSKQDEGSAFAFHIEAKRINARDAASFHRRRSSAAMDLDPQAAGKDSTAKRPDAERSANDSFFHNGIPNKLNILVVEDNAINQRVLVRQLQAADCSVVAANNGQEALETLKTSTCWHQHPNEVIPLLDNLEIDIVLMDWEMPIMNGLQCTKQIRAWEKEGRITKRLQIIGTTANVRQEQIDTALAAGFDDVLAKPFTVDTLLKMIRA